MLKIKIFCFCWFWSISERLEVENGIEVNNGVLAEEEPPRNPCQPSPCGPNSQCREVNSQAVCSCLATYVGSPPGCRPECTVSAECPQNHACINQKCEDPCPGTCGLSAQCSTVNHSPICSCLPGFTGDPFTRCYTIPRKGTPFNI